VIAKIVLVGAGVILLLASPIRAQSSSTVMTSGASASASAATTAGAFQSLSPGDQKIANALFAAQTTRGSGRLSRDQIATLKGSAGWGQVFGQMKADGVLQARNLGQVVSRSEHQMHASPPGSMSQSSRTVVITNGLGRAATFTPVRPGSVAATRNGRVPTFVPAHSGSTAVAGAGQGVAVTPAGTTNSVASGKGFSHGGGAAHGR
jgi:hypothetical protein